MDPAYALTLKLRVRNLLRMLVSGLTVGYIRDGALQITPPPPTGTTQLSYLRGYLTAVLGGELVVTDLQEPKAFDAIIAFAIVDTGGSGTLEIDYSKLQ